MQQNGKISMLEPSVFLWYKFVISLGDHNHLKKWNFLVACLFICTIWTWKKNLVLEAELMILEEYSYMHLDRYRSAIPN